MVTKTLVEPVWQTTCDRCGAVMPRNYDERREWTQLERRKSGAPTLPGADLCPPCGNQLAQFLDGKAVPDVTRR